jgi:hypothetical protein
MASVIHPTVPIAGQGAGSAAEPWPADEIAVRADEIFARRLDTGFAAGVRDLLHDPGTGLSSLSGEAALEAIAGAYPALEELKQRTLGEAIGPRQRALVEPAINARLEWAAGTIGRLAERATVQVDDASVAERLAGLGQDAAASWDDPAHLRTLGRAAVSELRWQGERRGWDASEIDARTRSGLSDLYAGAVEAAIGKDLEGAASLLAHAREVIDPARLATIDRRLTRAREDGFLREVDAALSALPLDPAAPPALDAFNARIAELTPEDASDGVRGRLGELASHARRRAERQWHRRQAEAGGAALDWLKQNPDLSSLFLPEEMRAWLASDQFDGLETLEQRGRLLTDPDLYWRLDRLSVYEPDTFATLDLDRHRLSLDDGDFERLLGWQKAIAEGAADPTFVRYRLARAGIDRMLDAEKLGTDNRKGRVVHADVRDRPDDSEPIEGQSPNRQVIDTVVGDEMGPAGRGIAPVVEPPPGTPEHDASYRQLDLAGVFGRPLIADSPRLKKLIRSGAYSKHYAHYHEYELPPAVLCTLGQEGCSVERAYEALRVHAVPGGPRREGPVVDGERSPVSFGGLRGGRIRTHVEEETHSIINVTEPDHVFRDGLVQRRIVVEGDKVVLRTFGIGNNSSKFMAGANEEVAGVAFAESTDRIRAAVDVEGQRRSRDGWYILAPGPSRLTP